METLAPLRLPPLVSRPIEQFLSRKELLFQLLDGLGSPLNILFPQDIRSNIDQFHSVFAQNNIAGRIFFAHKCNQSNSLIRQLSIEEASVEFDAGYLRPEECVRTQLSIAQQLGCHLHLNEQVKRVFATESGAGVETNQGSYYAASVVLTAGPWLPELLLRTALSTIPTSAILF